MNSYRIGVDIGGTFTDLVMMDESSGELRLVKMASTPSDPSVGFLNTVERALRESKVAAADISYNVHGTTVATNTLIEGKGARAALVATEGFRDVLEIARQIRPKLYDIFCEKPKPVIPRNRCYGVPERLDYAGQTLAPLDDEAVRDIARRMKEAAVESVAVCLLHSYVNPSHEKRVRDLLREEMPGVFLSISSDLCPEMREYFRASTTAINAVVMPIVTRYLENLENRLTRLGVGVGLHLMTSAGGVMASDLAKWEPVHLIESGPAAGVIATRYLGDLVGTRDVISFDMGGTTAKVGLVEAGTVKIAPHFEVGSAAVAESKGAGYPVRTPVVDLVEIGAGGGSIAWIDPGGALRVGPRSGSADPGPACYGKGQQEPCITDANLVLGRLNPDYFIGGEQTLDPELAEAAVGKLDGRLGLGVVETANGIIEIANANMIGAVRTISVQRGFDPRDFVLVAFGGAGPMHANGLARELGIPKVLIPMSPGVTSALGLLVSDIKHDYVRTFHQQVASLDLELLNRSLSELAERGKEVLFSEGISEEDITFAHYLDMRYVGQGYELKIEIPTRDLTEDDKDFVNAAFYREHERAYGYADDTEPTESVALRLTAIGGIRQPRLRRLETGTGDAGDAVKNERPVYFAECGDSVPCKVYNRYRLKSGDRITGPAIVEEVDSTIVLHPDYRADVDLHGNILIQETAV
jgi:N-methylhydantoinase A